MRATFIVGLAVCLFSAKAWATHKSWNLVDPGANCHSELSGLNSSQFVYVDGAIKNNGPNTFTVTCPVTLAGRYGSQGTSFSMARWPTSRAGTVYGYDGSASADIDCLMMVISNTGSVYTSARRFQSPAGANGRAVTVRMVQSGSWGSEIGSGSTLSLRAMGYMCKVPPGSMIYAYEEKICQINSNCNGGDTNPIGSGTVATTAPVQDSGFACLADSLNPTADFYRQSGLQNNGINPFSVYCPLSRTSSDSRDDQGSTRVDRIELYSTGAAPNCKLSCRAQATGAVTYSSEFVPLPSAWVGDPAFPPTILRGSSSGTSNLCRGALGVSCSMPGNSHILGFIHQSVVPALDIGT
jgi:hypothetical protein